MKMKLALIVGVILQIQSIFQALTAGPPPNPTTDVVTENVSTNLESLRLKFLKLLQATSRAADPAALTNLFSQARTMTNTIGSLVTNIIQAQERIDAAAAKVQQAPIRKTEKQGITDDLIADRASLESLKTRLIDFSEIIERFIQRFEVSWQIALALRTETWGPTKALAALQRPMSDEYEHFRREMEVFDHSTDRLQETVASNPIDFLGSEPPDQLTRQKTPKRKGKQSSPLAP